MISRSSVLVVSLLLLSISIGLFAFDIQNKDRAADELAIRQHIDKIFQAYMKKDRETVKSTHSSNWRGFLYNSTSVLRGIDEYMKEAEGQGSFDRSRTFHIVGYKFVDFDIVFHENTGIVNYVADIFWQDQASEGSYRLRSIDIYGKEKGAWNQIASNICDSPQMTTESISPLLPISDETRQALLRVRHDVWQAFFSNDTERLKELIPSETIAINPGRDGFSDQAEILRSSKAFAESGARLVNIEFPATEIQFYGGTVIMYSDYVYEVEENSERNKYSGRATEIFVDRNNSWQNVGWHLDDGK